MKKEPVPNEEITPQMRAEAVFECPNSADKTFWECQPTLQAFIKYCCKKSCGDTKRDLTPEQIQLMERAKDILVIMHRNEYSKIPYTHENPV